MNKILAHIWKDGRSRFSLLASGLSILTCIFYLLMWLTTPYEATEMPVAVIALAIVTAVVLLAASVKNLFHVVNLAGFTLAVVTLFTFIAGRVSYLAFYFSGDAMATGLSPLFIVTLIFSFLTVVVTAIALFAEKVQDK